MRNNYPFNNRTQNEISSLVSHIILGPFFLLFSLLDGKGDNIGNGIDLTSWTNFPKLFEKKVTHIIYGLITIGLSITAVIFFIKDIWWMIAIIFVFHTLEFSFYTPIGEFNDFVRCKFEFKADEIEAQKKTLKQILNIWLITVSITLTLSLTECFLPMILERDISSISYIIIILFTLFKILAILLLLYNKKYLDDHINNNESFINISQVKENL